jgi:K+-transporting ATPase A subunit
LYRYSKYKGFNGGGIYDAGNDFSLNTNTIILFVFVLCVALVFSWGYFMSARAFTKQFVWLTGILNVALAAGTAVYYLYK